MKKLASIMILVFSMGTCAFSFHPSQQYSEEGEKIDLEVNSGTESDPNSSSAHVLSAYYYSELEEITVTCQGYGNATVSILNPMLQVIASEVIDPSISTIGFFDAPIEPGRYLLLIVTSSFTAYGTFAVE